MKLTRADESNIRAQFYDLATEGFKNYETEPVCEGRLVEFEVNGEKHYATIKITIHNSEKFDLANVRREYIDKLEAAANRQAEAAAKAKLKVERAAAKVQDKQENIEDF